MCVCVCGGGGGGGGGGVEWREIVVPKVFGSVPKDFTNYNRTRQAKTNFI